MPCPMPLIEPRRLLSTDAGNSVVIVQVAIEMCKDHIGLIPPNLVFDTFNHLSVVLVHKVHVLVAEQGMIHNAEDFMAFLDVGEHLFPSLFIIGIENNYAGSIFTIRLADRIQKGARAKDFIVWMGNHKHVPHVILPFFGTIWALMS